MTFAKVLLGFNGLIFAVYGAVCLVVPSLPAGYAGMDLPGASATTEVVAMYGGLQLGLGLFFLRAIARPELLDEGLFVMALLIGCLASARAIGLLVHGTTEYNVGAVAYEATTAVLAVVAWKRLRSATEPIGEPA